MANYPKLIAFLVVLVLVCFGVYIYFKPESIQNTEYAYSDNPKDWFYENESGHIQISVEEATGSHASYDAGDFRYYDYGGEEYLLTIDGFYGGEWFNIEALNENSKPAFRIGEDIKPNDGISEAFALVKKQGSEFTLYLFVDEDWKTNSNSNINIIVGDNLSKNETFIERKFDFSNSKNGIYVDKLENISFLMQKEVLGGIILGEVGLEDMQLKNLSKTYLLIR